jgi:hypothetical protein
VLVVLDANHVDLVGYALIPGLSTRIRTCRKAQRLRLSYPIAHGSPPREQGMSPSAIVRPRESPYRNGGLRSVQSQGRTSLDLLAIPTTADGAIVRVKASDIARVGLIACGVSDRRSLTRPVALIVV